MGWIRHHGIVVTGSGDRIAAAHAKALAIFPTVSPLLAGRMNAYESFFVPPDGSKEGWKDSQDGDVERETFIEWLKAEYRGVDWLEYADDVDNDNVRITRGSSLSERDGA
jgi:hypothetical protein